MYASMALRITLAITLAALVGCSTSSSSSNSSPGGAPSLSSSPEPKHVSAKDIVAGMKAAGLPIGAVDVYDEKTDSNKLLGRPGQYIGKANFEDTRLTPTLGPPKLGGIDVNSGGAVEVFADSTSLGKRKSYFEGLAKGSSLFTEFDYAAGLGMLRLSHALSPTQTKQYVTAFTKAAGGLQ
jgi:hypothetical protein